MNSSSNLKPRFSKLPNYLLLCFSVFFCNFSIAQSSSTFARLIFEPSLLSTASNTLPNQSLSSSERADLERSIENYKSTITNLKENNGSNTELIEQLGPLGVALQNLDRHDEAIVILEEGISLSQENSLAQIPLQEQIVLSYLSTNDVDTVDDIEDLIYSLYQENYEADDQEMFFAMVSLADWNLSAYFQENYGPRGMNSQQNVLAPTQRQTGFDGGDGNFNAIMSGNIKNITNSDITDARIRKVASLYEDYQEALFATGNVQLAVIQEISKRTAGIAFITKQEMDFERDSNIRVSNYEGSRIEAVRNSSERLDESYKNGRDALDFLVTTLESVEGIQKEVIATALLDLADWHLTYGKNQAAQDTYALATQTLLDAGFSQDNIDIALATPVPLPIPMFATHLYTRASAGVRAGQNPDFQGYVDISFNVNDIGNASRLRITNSSDENSAALERLIEVQFRSMKFRPNLVNGELGSPGSTSLRYYYAY